MPGASRCHKQQGVLAQALGPRERPQDPLPYKEPTAPVSCRVHAPLLLGERSWCCLLHGGGEVWQARSRGLREHRHRCCHAAESALLCPFQTRPRTLLYGPQNKTTAPDAIPSPIAPPIPATRKNLAALPSQPETCPERWMAWGAEPPPSPAAASDTSRAGAGPVAPGSRGAPVLRPRAPGHDNLQQFSWRAQCCSQGKPQSLQCRHGKFPQTSQSSQRPADPQPVPSRSLYSRQAPNHNGSVQHTSATRPRAASHRSAGAAPSCVLGSRALG